MHQRSLAFSFKKLFVAYCNDDLHRDLVPNQSLHETYLISPPVHSFINRSENGQTNGFCIYYDSRTRNPLCVVEKISANSEVFERKSTSKRPSFFPDERIDPRFKVHPKEFVDSKYDRGHMVPAADFSSDSNLYKETFTMANISPQDHHQAPALNRGFWASFEGWIRNLIVRHGFKEIIICTGPAFAPIFINNQWMYMNSTIGTFPQLITVPTHFFKIIVGRKSGSTNDATIVSIGAFLVPNSSAVEKNSSLNQFMVRLDQLESILGFRLLPDLINSQVMEAIDSSVPLSRDLANVLNAKNMIKINEKSEPQFSVAEQIQIAHTKQRAIFANNMFTHLCSTDGIDCASRISAQ